MHRAPALAFLLLVGAAFPDEQRRLVAAKQEAAAASVRADAFAAAAHREQDAARRARDEERALATRVTAAAANVRAAEARVALVARLQAQQRERLATAQAPVARLLAALTALARRPTIAAIAQPGSVADLIHVRAVLGAALPVVQARTADVRAELAATRRLQASAVLALRALADDRADLDRRRGALAQLEAAHSGQAQVFTRRAVVQSDQALALGEQARDLADGLTERGQANVTAGELGVLAGPAAPPGRDVAAALPTAIYRLPVRGTLVTGLGEVSPAGVRARGLTFAVAPLAPVVVPAGGTVRYVGRFRGFGLIVVIDHGAGWTTLLTGLASVSVKAGQQVAGDAALGQAGSARDAQVTVELRRRGRPVDIAALLG